MALVGRRTVSTPSPGRSLVRRVTWAVTGTVIVALTLVMTLVFLVHRQMEKQLIDTLIVNESVRMGGRLELLGPQWQGTFQRDFSSAMVAWAETPDQPMPELPERVRALPSGLHYLDGPTGTWHVAVQPVGVRGKIYVRYDATDSERARRGFGLVLLAIAGCFMGAAYLVGRKVARLAVAPVQQLTEQLSRWAPGAPGIAIEQAHETGRLMEAFNRMQGQVEDSIAREREFSANLSHEIRTPLAAIRSDGEMLLHGGRLQAPDAARVTRIVRAVDGMAASLEGVRGMTQGWRTEPEPVSLRLAVATVFDSLDFDPQGAGLSLVNQVPQSVVLTLDRYALLTVLRNLTHNAHHHAAPGHLVVTWLPEAGCLCVTDDGPGIAAAQLPLLFERYYRGRLRDAGGPDMQPGGPAASAHREGLGLAIAQRVAEIQGWQLSVHSPVADGRGTTFRLYLPPTSAASIAS